MASTVTLNVTVDTATAQELAARITTTIGDSLTRSLAGHPVDVEAVTSTTASAVMAEILRVTGPQDDDVARADGRADRLAAALREVLDAFTTARRDDGVIAGHFLEGAIHPDDMARWRNVLDPQPEKPKCARCKGRGYVPDWQDWDAYHGEPKPKPCPDCRTKEPS